MKLEKNKTAYQKLQEIKKMLSTLKEELDYKIKYPSLEVQENQKEISDQIYPFLQKAGGIVLSIEPPSIASEVTSSWFRCFVTKIKKEFLEISSEFQIGTNDICLICNYLDLIDYRTKLITTNLNIILNCDFQIKVSGTGANDDNSKGFEIVQEFE